MPAKKIFLLLAILLFFSGSLYAGELISQEAVQYYNEGVKLQKAGNFSVAEVNYRKTLLLDPYNVKWQKFIANNEGLMYAQLGELDKAEESFNAALKLDPDYLPAQLNLGLVYEKRRTRLESLEYWASMFCLEKLKPKSFTMAEEQGPAKK